MAELESAEEFARALVTHLADTLIGRSMPPAQAKAHAIALIEADRAAVRVALLDEIETERLKVRGYHHTASQGFFTACRMLRAKYERPAGEVKDG